MKKINFAQETDTRLKRFLEHYCLRLPEDGKGNFLRGDAIERLVSYQNKLMAEEDRRVKVIFHRTGDAVLSGYVLIVHNGFPYQIPYDTESVIPTSALRVIDDSVLTKFNQIVSPTTGEIEYTTSEHRQYPYTVIEYMDAEGAMSIPEDSINEESKK